MRDAGILDGDLVIVRPDSGGGDGVIAAVRVEDPDTGEDVVTVKRLYRERGGCVSNPPIHISAPSMSVTLWSRGSLRP